MGVYQLISAHCALTGHQKRFGFSETTAFLCGHAFESDEHFLFECSRFCQEQLSTLLSLWIVCLALSAGLPHFRLFHYTSLWNALVSFVAKTKHLNLL